MIWKLPPIGLEAPNQQFTAALGSGQPLRVARDEWGTHDSLAVFQGD